MEVDYYGSSPPQHRIPTIVAKRGGGPMLGARPPPTPNPGGCGKRGGGGEIPFCPARNGEKEIRSWSKFVRRKRGMNVIMSKKTGFTLSVRLIVFLDR